MRHVGPCIVVALFILGAACNGGDSITGTVASQAGGGTAPGTGTGTGPVTMPPAGERAFTVINQCAQPVWVAVQSNAGVTPTHVTGYALAQGQNFVLNTNNSWGGRIWGRTACDFNTTPSCETGTCGSSLDCNGSGGTPPASWAEFTLNGAAGKDFYDVSLVDGYNLPVQIEPTQGLFTPDPNQGQYWCGTPTCTSDLLATCPTQLQVLNNQNQVIACKSACLEFGTSQYCCSDANNTSATCPPTSYSEVFKAACPTQYSYAYDDKTSTFTCMSQGYTVTFCP